MYFWNIKQLCDHLIQQGLAQRALFIYVFLFAVANQALLEFGFLFPSAVETRTDDYIWALFSTASVAVGTWLCYYFNGAAAGREFAERYFSIGFVVGLRTLALLFPVMTAVIVIGGALMEEDGTMPQEIDMALNAVAVIWVIAYYWRVITHINIVARARKS